MQDPSPRVAVNQFLRLCNERRFDEATRYLDIPRQRAPLLRDLSILRRLKLILEQTDLQVFNQPSRCVSGHTRCGSSEPSDLVITVIPSFIPEAPIRLMCRLTEDGTWQWMFSRGTLERIRHLCLVRESVVRFRQDSLPLVLRRLSEALKHRLELTRWKMDHRDTLMQATLGQRLSRLAAFVVALVLFLSTLGHFAAECLNAFVGFTGGETFSWPGADPASVEVGVAAGRRSAGVV